MTPDTPEGRVPVLMYHRVGAAHNVRERKYCVAPQVFNDHLRRLADAGYTAVPMDRFFAWIEGGQPLPDRSLVITFDDGFLGVYEHAFPLLKALGWPATIFLVTDLIGKDDQWSRRSDPSAQTYPLMDVPHIIDMQNSGFAFQSHSRTHVSLPSLDDVRLREEVADSRSNLIALLGRPVEFFAYPYGHLDARVAAAVATAGYRAAFSTQPGFNRRDVEPLRIRRLDVFGDDSATMLLRKVRFGANDGSFVQSCRYYLSRFRSRFTS